LANIAASLSLSRLIGPDIDPRNGGSDTWSQLCKELGISAAPDTWMSMTGGGGVHYLYRAPEGFTTTTDSLGKGVDVKWHGYFILPPSTHLSGNTYEWALGQSPFDMADAAPLPEPLRRRLTAPPADDDRIPQDEPVAALWTRPCPEGQRNKTLTRLLGWLQSDGVPAIHAEGILEAWNTAMCQPPLEDGYIAYQVKWAYGKWDAPGKATLEDDPQTQTGTAFIDAVDYMDRPPPAWRIEGVLPDRVFSALVGHPGSYKSFYALDKALSIATGTPFHGRRVRQGPVLYILAEGAGAFGLRIRAWQVARGVQIPRGALYILPNVVPLNDRDAVVRLIQQVLSFEVPFVHIVVDTFSRSIAGADENLQRDMSIVVDAIGLVQRMLDCGVQVVHHSNKGDGFRGSTVTPGALDTIIVLKRNDDGTVTIHCEKQKDVEQFNDYDMRAEVVDLAAWLPPVLDEDDDLVIRAAPSSLVLEQLSDADMQDRRKQADKVKVKPLKRDTWAWKFGLVLVQRFGRLGAKEEDWKTASASGGVYDPDPQRQAFYDAKEALIKGGWVAVENTNGRVSYHPTDVLIAVVGQ